MTQAVKKGTKQRILEAASDVFAECGFEKGTVRDICTRARANVAAVNYHFRDKQELYLEVLNVWRVESSRRFPMDGGLPADASVQERLRAYYAAMLKRIFLSGADAKVSYNRARVILQEIASGLIRETGDAAANEMEATLRPIVLEILGDGAQPMLVQDCVDSCMGQATAYFVFYVYDPGELQAMLSVEEIDRVADHMTAFALGGIRNARLAARD